MSKGPASTRYCYHCGLHHPAEEMVLVVSKTGKRWRCKKSLRAAKSDLATRDAFGKTVSDANRREMEKLRRFRSFAT